MCGIIGYSGERDAVGVIMLGLERLEYRGYDSAGIAIMGSEQTRSIAVRKAAGALDHLKGTIAQRPLWGTSGIGHTRWATHGSPTARNAHPHLDCSGAFAVVHNGMLPDADSRRADLTKRGHVGGMILVRRLTP